MKKRPSILIYCDNYHLISGLPDEQLGLLFRALMEFSEREVNGDGASIPQYQQRYPTMGETAKAYFAFMAATVRRDAAVYREKCANYSAAAQRRHEAWREARRSRVGESSPSAASDMAAYVSRCHSDRDCTP